MEMLSFEPYSLSALKRALPYIRKSESRCSELSAGSLFMWQKGTDLQFCFWNNTLVIRQNVGEQPAWTWPMGEDVSGMVDKLVEYTAENSLPLRFYEIDDRILKVIQSDSRLQPSMSAYDIRWSDYIYSLEDVLTFSGKKYRGQRNHINKFKRLYGEPEVRFVNSRDREDLDKMLLEYRAEHSDANMFEQAELEMTERLLEVYEKLGLSVACLKVGGRVAAFSIGEKIGDTLLIHVEKALRRYEGIYPTMYQEFVKLMFKSDKGLKIVNREDDSGDVGLRISKKQYQPIGRVNKYLVHINSPAARVGKIAPILRDGIALTGFEERDKEAYLKLNTDIENNRFWGYDYREDDDIIGEIDENTFYDLAILDIKAGDSINFAIRTSVDGDMIGEGILWNFTANSAEVGCRLMPEYQRQGIGTAAFKMLSDFAEQTLKVKARARCFIENNASYRMIKASGFSQTGKDGKFYYFRKT